MDRKAALAAVNIRVNNINLVKHMLATEAVMKTLAQLLDGDVEEWGIAGLLHDIDVELTKDNPSLHGKLGADVARELGVSDEVSRAILCHNEVHNVPPETMMDKALFCADPLTGLITAAALIRPDKKLSGVTVDSLRKRFSEKRFAAGVNRDQLSACSEIGLSLDEFMGIGLEAMQGIAVELGL